MNFKLEMRRLVRKGPAPRVSAGPAGGTGARGWPGGLPVLSAVPEPVGGVVEKDLRGSRQRPARGIYFNTFVDLKIRYACIEQFFRENCNIRATPGSPCWFVSYESRIASLP